MRVLLCTLNAKYIHVNTAIRLLYSLNRNSFPGLEWKEFTIKEDPDHIASDCSAYDIVAFSCYIWNITQTLEVCRRIKEKNPTCKILLGGPEVSYEYEEILNLPCIDFIIAGEGEIPFSQFLSNFPKIEFIKGLAYKTDGKISFLPSAETFDLKNYEHIMPYAYDDPSTLANRVLYIETSRGCPYKCEFCLASLDNAVRYLPDKYIKNTLLYLMQHGKTIKFLDRTFNIKKNFTIDIFEFILKNRREGNIFQFEITADILHPDIMAFILEKVPVGIFRFEIGIQTVNQKANLDVKRKQNFLKTKEIILKLQHKIEMHLDLIVGLPFDTITEIKYSFEEVFRLFAPELQLGFLKFLKGTPMRDKAIHEYEFDPMPPYTLIKSKYLSESELQSIVCLEHALEIYWNRKRAIHLLRYVALKYSSFDFLMGLGIYFGTRRPYHDYTLNDIYQIAAEYIRTECADDPVLLQLLTLDHVMQFKSKPGTTFLAEDESRWRDRMIEAFHSTKGKFRHMALPLNISLKQLEENNLIEETKHMLLVSFNGIDRPTYFSLSQENLMEVNT